MGACRGHEIRHHNHRYTWRKYFINRLASQAGRTDCSSNIQEFPLIGRRLAIISNFSANYPYQAPSNSSVPVHPRSSFPLIQLNGIADTIVLRNAFDAQNDQPAKLRMLERVNRGERRALCGISWRERASHLIRQLARATRRRNALPF